MRQRRSAVFRSAISLVAVLSAFSVTVSVSRAADTASEKTLNAGILQRFKDNAINPIAPVYIRIFKEESELEVWKMRVDGRYVLIKTYPICNWSGDLGPKQQTGDLMSPEGFYSVTAERLKPDSKYHLALNMGYPNALDRSLNRSGSFLMVHGDCKSVGCYAMSNDGIEEIYAFAREAIANGQIEIPLHAFPFRMTEANLGRHGKHAAAKTWEPLKQAYQDFAKVRQVPVVSVCDKRYLVNPAWKSETPPDALAADGECPAYTRKVLKAMPRDIAKDLSGGELNFAGTKLRNIENIASWRATFGSAAERDVAAKPATGTTGGAAMATTNSAAGTATGRRQAATMGLGLQSMQ